MDAEIATGKFVMKVEIPAPQSVTHSMDETLE
jgi:hypothetical protein